MALQNMSSDSDTLMDVVQHRKFHSPLGRTSAIWVVERDLNTRLPLIVPNLTILYAQMQLEMTNMPRHFTGCACKMRSFAPPLRL